MVRLVFQIIRNSDIPSLVLSCDNQRYIFNVPETFQRYYREHRLKMTQGPVFFFTRSSTETVAGLIGLMLTLFQEQFSVNSRMYGPSALGELISVLRYNEVAGICFFNINQGFKTLPFSYYDLVQLKTKVLGMKQLQMVDDILIKSNNCNFQDQLRAIKEIKIEIDVDQSNHNDASKQMINGQYEDQNITVIPIKLYDQIAANKVEESKDEPTQKVSIQYAVVSKKQPGKVIQEKLQSFKIDKSKLGILFKQGSLLMDDGSTITVESVRSKDTNPAVIFILDITSENQIVSLEQQSEFIKLINQVETNNITLQAFVHLTQPDIVITEKYQQFLQKFSNYDNILCNFQQVAKDELNSVHQNFQFKSLQLCKEFYNHLPMNFPLTEDQKIPKMTFLKDNIKLHGFYPLYEYTIYPPKQSPYGPLQNLEYDQVFKKLLPNPESLTQIGQIQKYQVSNEERKLIFLGTGSMKPGKYRNVSSNLISKPNANILLDCGEGTWKQLQDQNIDITNKPLIIWISHVHSDHHLGILNLILQYTKKSPDSQLYVLIPALMIPWVYHYQRLIPSFMNTKFIPIQYFLENRDNTQQLIQQAFFSQRIRDSLCPLIDNFTLQQQYQQTFNNYIELKTQLANDFGIKELQPVPVEHCPEAFGIALIWLDGFKVSYSGDTRPCKSFSDCSINADLMIHEATFSDELQDNAIQNMHSTVREAVELAIESKSKFIALTHFSQRYAKSGITVNPKSVQSTNSIPDKYSDDEYFKYLKKNSIYAVDHMGAYFDSFQYLAPISQIVGRMFPDDE